MKKLLSTIISFSLLVTTLPINSFAKPTIIIPQVEFSSLAKITSAAFYDSDTTIVNIQDLHNNKEVQDNILKLLETFNKEFKNLEVYIEGSNSAIDFSKLASTMNQKEMSALMNALYSNDKLTGAEFFGYKDNKVLQPTEDKEIYEQNIQNYSFLLKNRNNINQLLSNKYSNIRNLDRYLTSQQRKLLKFYNAYLNKKVSSEKFYAKVVSELNRKDISILNYINTKLYIDITNASKKINQKMAEMQLKSILASIKNTLTYQQYTELLADSKNLSDINVIFAYLSANVDSKDKFTKYPDLFRLINLREISSLINPLELINEEREIMEDILLSYSTNTINKDIVFINVFYQTYKKLLYAAISSNEYIYYKDNYPRFVALYKKYTDSNLLDLMKYARTAEMFNELNLKRNTSFINNITKNVKKGLDSQSQYRGKYYNTNKILSTLDKQKTIKVIISGGFHTEGINSLLDENKISYITLTPNVKDIDPMYEEQYYDSIIKQAEADINAISKKPFTQQAAQVIIDNVVSSLDSILDNLLDNKSLEEISNIINGVIKSSNIEDIVSFNINEDGVATLTVEDKTYTLDYSKGKVEIQTNTTTTLAKNLKTLIAVALENQNVINYLTQDKEIQQTKLEFNKLAKKIFYKYNILLPSFANNVMEAIVKHSPENSSSYNGDLQKVYSNLEKVILSQFTDITTENISIASGSLFIGARNDGYGNTEEYASLFYVVWGKKEGASIVKKIFISEDFLNALANMGMSDAELKEFFTNLIIHEKMEHLAINGGSKAFNSKYKKYPRTPEGFHKYIRNRALFTEFVKEQQYGLKQIEAQVKLLDVLDRIVTEYNKNSSEYSNIISLVSLENGIYSDSDLDRFLSIRFGDEEAIKQANKELAREIYLRLRKAYDVPDSEFDIDDFIDTIEEYYVIVYRESDNYMHFDDMLTQLIEVITEEHGVVKNIESRLSSLKPKSVSEKEDVSKSIDVSSKKVIFIEDIVSRQSNTYNKIYTNLKDNDASLVQTVAAFDLSNEPKDTSLITEETYKKIIRQPTLIKDLLNKTQGNIQKYAAYWLVRLSKEKDGIDILQQITQMDEKVVNNLIQQLVLLLANKTKIEKTNPSEIMNLIILLSLSIRDNKNIKDIRIDELTKEDIAFIREKYKVLDIKQKVQKEQKNKGQNEQQQSEQNHNKLIVDYDTWSDNVSMLIMYAYMCDYEFVEARGINNLEKEINGVSIAEIIQTYCDRFNTSIIDTKTKIKYSYKREESELKSIEKQYNNLKNKVKDIKNKFSTKIATETKSTETKAAEIKAAEIKAAEEEYVKDIKEVMLEVKKIVMDYLRKEKGIYLDDSMFAIIIGGSLAKGNMMADSEIFFDIIVRDNIISRSIEQHFTPLYSEILTQIGLINYKVSSYSTTTINQDNMNTFVDEHEVIPYLNYSLLYETPESYKGELETILRQEAENAQKLYEEYMSPLLQLQNSNNSKKSKKAIIAQLNAILTTYFTISTAGKGRIGNSFYSIYDDLQGQELTTESKIFTTRWSLKALETMLNRILIEQMFGASVEEYPVSVKDQIQYIKKHKAIKLKSDVSIDDIEKAWETLSISRYEHNNEWRNLTQDEIEAIKNINKFIAAYGVKQEQETKDSSKQKQVTNIEGFLEVIEDFVYENTQDLSYFRTAYTRYAHLEDWRISAQGKTDETKTVNDETFIMAQAISLLIDMGDIKDIKSKLGEIAKNIKGIDGYVEKLINQLETIKKIDTTFKDYSNLEGERSLQNYWNLVAQFAGDESTLLALISHKLTKASDTKKEEDIFLIYSVYLPLSKRFGNAHMYEYVRNSLFELTKPAEYLNVLEIIETMYGVPYTDLEGITSKIAETVQARLEKEMPKSSFHINYRPKSLYSVYEKLNSSRRDDEIDKTKVDKTQKGLVKFVMEHANEDLYRNILEEYVNKDRTKLTIKDKQQILKKMSLSEDKFLEALTEEQKEYVFQVILAIRKAIFANHDLLTQIRKEIESLEGCIDKENNLRILDNVKKQLENKVNDSNNGSSYITLFFVTLLSEEMKDLMGLHIVVEDEQFVDIVEQKEDDLVKVLNSDFVGAESFNSFKSKKNAQDRLKISGIRRSLPLEMCLYKHSSYENETYGFYNMGKISSPHYEYKTGRELVVYREVEKIQKQINELKGKQDLDSINKVTNLRKQLKTMMTLLLFEGTFTYEMDLSYLTKEKQEAKNFVLLPDEYSLSENFASVYEEIVNSSKSKIAGKIMFFVDYKNGSYVLDLPENATVYDLINSKYFADEQAVAVYNADGEPLGLDVKLETAGIYRVVSSDSISIGVKQKKVSKRAEIQHRRYLSEHDSDVSKFLKTIGTVSDINEVVSLLIFNETTCKMFDERNDTTKQQLINSLYDENSQNVILRNKEYLNEFLNIVSSFAENLKLSNMLLSVFLKRSQMIANHYNLSNVCELYEGIMDGVIEKDTISILYNTAVAILVDDISPDTILKKVVKALGEDVKIQEIDLTSKTPQPYNLVIGKKKYLIDSEEYDFSKVKECLDKILVEGKYQYVIDQADAKIDDQRKTAKNSHLDEPVFITYEHVRPQEFFPLTSLGNNVEELVKHAMANHSAMVGEILNMTSQIANRETSNSQAEIESLLQEKPVLMTQILLGLFAEDSYDADDLLSQESSYLTKEEVVDIKQTIKNRLTLLNISEVNISVSRTLDLVQAEDTYSFATMSIENGIATLYVSETFLRELDKQTSENKAKLLKALTDHEIREFLALIENPNLDYNAFHERIHNEESQRMLLEFAKSIVPNALRTKNAIYEEVNDLLEPSDSIDSLEPQLTIALLLGNLRVDSFEKTYKLYREGKIGKIFISGNTRGSLSIVENLRRPENAKYLTGTTTLSDANAYNTVEDLLSLKSDIFKSISKNMIDSVRADHSVVLLLDEKLNTPISKQEIFDVVSKDGVTEAAIIKWVILENARQDGLTRAEINQLIKSIVLETAASNTPENIANLLAGQEFKEFIAGKEDVNVVVIQTPLSQIRAMATLNKALHDNSDIDRQHFNVISIDFEMDFQKTFYCYNQDTLEVLTRSVGEWIRLITYTLKGDIIPVINGKEGLDAVPLQPLVDVLSLLPTFSVKEKVNLLKIFTNVEKDKVNIFETKEQVLEYLANNISTESNKYMLMAEIINYLYSESKSVEESQSVDRIEDILKEVQGTLLQETADIGREMAETRKILAAA